MSRIKSAVSDAFAAAFLRIYMSRLRDSGVWRFSLHVWKIIPAGVRNWINWRIVEPANDRSHQLVLSDKSLSSICDGNLGQFSLPATSVVELWRILSKRRPQKIIEMGSGLSTLVFAQYANRQSDLHGINISVLSLDHDEHWASETRKMLAKCGLERFAFVVHAPIADRLFDGSNIQAYAVDERLLREYAGNTGFDFCLIDGPPEYLSGRMGSLPLIAEYLSNGAGIYLDDADREREIACWTRWQRVYGAALSNSTFFAVPHGMFYGEWSK